MIVNSGRWFQNRIWTCVCSFCNVIARNFLDEIFEELYSDGMWMDGLEGIKTICSWSQYLWLIGQCCLNLD